MADISQDLPLLVSVQLPTLGLSSEDSVSEPASKIPWFEGRENSDLSVISGSGLGRNVSQVQSQVGAELMGKRAY